MKHKFRYEEYDVENHKKVVDLMLDSHHIPRNKLTFVPPTGFVVYMGDEPVCLGFLIKCDNGMGIFSDLLSNKFIKQPFRSEGVEYLRHLLSVEAERAELQYITSFTKHEAHVKRLEGLGFQILEKGLTQMGRFLWL